MGPYGISSLLRKNRKIQNDIYQCFHKDDLQTFVNALKSPQQSKDFDKIRYTDIYIGIRKLAGLFLCELLYDNQQLQMLFCDQYNILYSKGKIALNQFPEEFKYFVGRDACKCLIYQLIIVKTC